MKKIGAVLVCATALAGCREGYAPQYHENGILRAALRPIGSCDQLDALVRERIRDDMTAAVMANLDQAAAGG